MSDVNVLDQPSWAAAAASIVIDGFGYGDEIPHSYLYAALGLEMPEPDTKFKDFNKTSMLYMEAIFKIKEYLLVEKRMALKSIKGRGFVIVAPKDQTSFALEEVEKAMKRALSQGAKRVAYTNTDMLSTEERVANANAKAKIAGLARIALASRRSPWDMIEDNT